MHTHGKPSPRTAIVLAPTDAAQLSAAASVLPLVGQDGDRYQRSRNVAHTTASPRTTIIRGTGEAGSGRYQPAPPPPPPLPSPPTLSSIHTILERQPLPRPQTITVGGSFANVSARDSKVSDFSHGFSRIGIDNQAPMLFEVDQRHLLQLVKDFNDSLLDGDFLLLRTIQNPSGAGASPQRSSSDRGAAAVNSTALYRQGGASFLMQASAELARANMIRQASEGRVTPGSASTSDMPSGSGPPGGLGQLQHVASPLTERYLPSEVHEQLCGLPPAAAVSMRFRLSPWRSLFEKWIAGLLEERRPEPKHLAGRAVSMSTGGGVSSSRKPTTTTTASSDLAWESVRPTRVHSKNVDPVLQLELLIQCAFRVADLHALSEEVPSAGQPVAALLAMPSPRGALPQSLASSQAISRSMGPSSYVTYGAGGGGGTAKRHESFSFAGTPRQQAAQQKAQVYDRMVKPPKGVPHLICTATALFALVENLQEMFGPGCAPLMREVLRVLMPLILNAPAVRASAPDMLLAQPLSQKQQRGSGGQSDGTLEDRNAGGVVTCIAPSHTTSPNKKKR
ncbi:Hypothetical protein, putative [Bodo saltans]|uniref:Uncharacterized protein n=1 Tax=Bodo saltans TaxID=75058 RepID=A0A0S4KJS6_BODSA|nr:Hypothetical protein, putative [Bodo saltans]|eukprot:CUI14713.1 Hypothetical protein, putative [Bodo saltans]